MTTGHRVPSLRTASTVASLLLIFSALILGLWPVGGLEDGESFNCGSAFLGSLKDLGYEGSQGYDACLHERRHLRLAALADLVIGAGLLVVVRSERRRSSAGDS